MEIQSKKMKDLLQKAKSIALFGHINPDGDCIWSLLWFWSLLEKQGKKVHYFTPTKPSKIYNFLPGIEKIKDKCDYGKYDLLVFLDFSDFSRIQDFIDGHEEYFHNHTVIIIDHHVSKWFPKSWLVKSDPNAMSACEVIFELTYPWWPKLYDATIATYFYLGLTTDSWNFRYDEDHERILKNALKLVQLGADKKAVVDNAFRRKSLAGIKMMELLFKRLTKKWDLVYTWYTDKDIKKLGIDREEADYGQIIIQDVQEAKITAIFRNEGKRFNWSLRTKYDNVEKIAKQFGGGGHIHAAGFKLPAEKSFSKQIQKVVKQMLSYMK